MRTPGCIAARMTGAIVGAVLAAAPGAASAEDLLPMPFPGAADEAAIDAFDGPAGGASSAAGGAPAEAVPAEAVPAEAVPGEAVPAHAAAGNTRAGDEGKAAARGVTDPARRDRAEGSPGPASRLLRVLAETGERPGTPNAPASPDDGDAASVSLSGPRVFASEGCPRALLRRLLAGAADDAGALTALGIEREVLTLCRERQEIVTALLETEARLRELRAPQEAPVTERSTATVVQAPTAAVRESVAPGPAQPSPLRAALAGADGPEKAATPRGPRYAWFSIIGTAGALRAGVTDGTGVWFVRAGDALPGGAHVAAIAGRPPAVRVREAGEGEETPLPYRPRPGGSP